MAVHGVRGTQGARLDGADSAPAPEAASAARQEAQVSRTPTSSRPDPTRQVNRSGKNAAQAGLHGKPSDFLTNPSEREAYAFILHSDRPIVDILDRLDKLTPASYNRILHASALTKVKEGGTLLDKVVRRGGGEPGKAELAQRFFKQVACKLAGQ